MPEGPEIRRAADRIARVLTGRRVLFVECHLPALARRARALAGAHVVSVTPRSKALLIRFSTGAILYSHNQLYGRWSVDRAVKQPDSRRALRVAIATQDHVARLYSATDIELLDEASLAVHPYVAQLGLELLDDNTTIEDAVRQAHAAPFQRRALAGLLLDQRFYAGLGNYLRSEILYVARLRHSDVLGHLSAEARTRLGETAFTLTHQAYRHRGVTNDLDRAAALKAQGLSFGRYRHHVFDRADEPCWQCAHPIERVDVGGRGIYFCPRCQALPTTAAARTAAPAARRPRPRRPY
jgi:endonuclease VIII